MVNKWSGSKGPTGPAAAAAAAANAAKERSAIHRLQLLLRLRLRGVSRETQQSVCTLGLRNEIKDVSV